MKLSSFSMTYRCPVPCSAVKRDRKIRINKAQHNLILSKLWQQNAGAFFIQLKDPRPPGSGKVTAKVKGVRLESESEGRRRQNSDPANRNHVRPKVRGRPLSKPKPNMISRWRGSAPGLFRSAYSRGSGKCTGSGYR